MKIIKSKKYKKFAQAVSMNGFDALVRAWFINEGGSRTGLQNEVWTQNGDEEEAKKKFIESLIENQEIKQKEDILNIEVLKIGPHTKLKETHKERADLGWRLMQFEDVNEVGPNQREQSMDTMTPNIMSVGRGLYGSGGEAQLTLDEYMGAMDELKDILKSNKDFINPLSNEDIKEVKLLLELLWKDFNTYGSYSSRGQANPLQGFF